MRAVGLDVLGAAPAVMPAATWSISPPRDVPLPQPDVAARADDLDADPFASDDINDDALRAALVIPADEVVWPGGEEHVPADCYGSVLVGALPQVLPHLREDFDVSKLPGYVPEARDPVFKYDDAEVFARPQAPPPTPRPVMPRPATWPATPQASPGTALPGTDPWNPAAEQPAQERAGIPAWGWLAIGFGALAAVTAVVLGKSGGNQTAPAGGV